MTPPEGAVGVREGRWAIKVVWLDGEEGYVLEGSGPTVMAGLSAKGRVAIFSKRRAQEQADFLRMGMEDEVQSINVVKAPR